MDPVVLVCGFVTDTSVLLGLLIFILLMLLNHVFVTRTIGLPPGPKFRLPIVGNMYAVEPDMRKFLRKYRKLYGDIYSLYLGTKLVIVIAGYGKIKEAFDKNADVFSNRPKGKHILQKVTRGLGVVGTDGEFWKEHRKFSVATLRHFGVGRSIIAENINAEVRLLLRAFEANEYEPFDPAKIIRVSVSNVINSISFGAHFDYDDARYGEILRRIEDQFKRIGNSTIGSFIPALALLPGDLFKVKQAMENSDAIISFLREFVNEHLQRYDENHIDDFTSAFIKEMKQQESSKEITTFTVDQLTMVLGDFFLAGTESMSTTLRWALVYLVNYPDIQEQLFKVISDTVGFDHLPSLQEKDKLPLVNAFIMECFRHANLTITSLGHATSRDVTFNGYMIPADAIILADFDSVFHDSTVWKEPDDFRPQRFIAEDGSVLKIEENIPFFVGRRSCIGKSLANMELFLFLSAIVQNFKISAPPGEDLSLENVDGVFGLAHAPKPFNILVTSRGIRPII